LVSGGRAATSGGRGAQGEDALMTSLVATRGDGIAPSGRILGLDVALAHTGWAVLSETGEDVEAWGVIEAPIPAGAASMARANFDRVGRLFEALGELFERFEAPEECTVAIECTDWSPGEAGERAAWIREAKARGALGLALATAFLACRAHAVEPVLLGANEWQREFGAQDGRLGWRTVKERVGLLVSLALPARFEERESERFRSGQVVATRFRIVDRRLMRNVPEHVTDALGLALVVRDRQRHADRLRVGLASSVKESASWVNPSSMSRSGAKASSFCSPTSSA
jgi:Holliday junction resolvasome RuvABC endonuclease subunit